MKIMNKIIIIIKINTPFKKIIINLKAIKKIFQVIVTTVLINQEINNSSFQTVESIFKKIKIKNILMDTILNNNFMFLKINNNIKIIKIINLIINNNLMKIDNDLEKIIC